MSRYSEIKPAPIKCLTIGDLYVSGQFIQIFMPPFSHLYNREDNRLQRIRLLCEFNGSLQLECLEQCWTLKKRYINACECYYFKRIGDHGQKEGGDKTGSGRLKVRQWSEEHNTCQALFNMYAINDPTREESEDSQCLWFASVRLKAQEWKEVKGSIRFPHPDPQTLSGHWVVGPGREVIKQYFLNGRPAGVKQDLCYLVKLYSWTAAQQIPQILPQNSVPLLQSREVVLSFISRILRNWNSR